MKASFFCQLFFLLLASTTTATPIPEVFWSFDNNSLDLYNNYNGNTSGNPRYTTSYLGTGAALSLNRSLSQYVVVSSPHLFFDSMSFTIEAWIYPISLTTADYGIFGQCQAATTDLCMFFIVRNLALYCGFWNDDLPGSTPLTMNQWSHVACVFNLATLTQSVYLNGVLDASRSSGIFQGTSGDTTIGVGYLTPPGSNFFNGYIDQMEFLTRAKNATEILNDATLVVYYSFDNGSLYDQGPNGINATASGSPTTVTGRVNQALQFSSGASVGSSYAAFTMLGVVSYPFTISIWVNPTSAYASSTIVYISTSWCLNLITMRSNGTINANLWNATSITASGPVLALNSWTHIGYTYSRSNGIRLYINGTQYSTSGPLNYDAAGTPRYVSLATGSQKKY